DFVRAHPSAELLRRPDRRGFKAGNLNHALTAAAIKADWVIIVDADETLPQQYVKQVASFISIMPEHVAFVQTRHASDDALPKNSTRFQRALGREINVFYSYELSLRQRYGFM